jgi:hypothetical protein
MGLCHTGSIGKYTPTHQAYSVTGVTGTPLATPIEAEPHSMVGVAVNGVPLMGLPLALNFDNCMGHTDTDHAYHYHLAPKCLFDSLGIPYPTNQSWWFQEDEVSFWPQSGPASPMVGVALDGVPIMGPYDATGSLTLSATLDECNGRTVDGEYQYVMTADAPYLPQCFKRVPGTVTLAAIVPAAACPKGGVQNTYHAAEEEGFKLPLPVCVPGVSQAVFAASKVSMEIAEAHDDKSDKSDHGHPDHDHENDHDDEDSAAGDSPAVGGAARPTAGVAAALALLATALMAQQAL